MDSDEPEWYYFPMNVSRLIENCEVIMINKIYIIGPVGSGKSTLARKLSKEYSFVCCELDSIVYEPDLSSPTGNRKRPVEERDSMLNSILSNKRWIVEDAGRAYFEVALQKADSIIHLEPPMLVRKWRILLRWIKQNLKLEKSGYTPSLKMLKAMFKWTSNYGIGTDGVKERLNPYKHKTTLVRTNREIVDYINEYLKV
jgi:adenylate kinase family enzyme